MQLARESRAWARREPDRSELGEVGRFDLVEPPTDLFDRTGDRDVAAVHHVDPVGDREGLADLLLDEPHADTRLGGRAQGLQKVLDDERCEAEGELVGQDATLGRGGPGPGRASVLPTREQPGGAASTHRRAREELASPVRRHAGQAEVVRGGEAMITEGPFLGGRTLGPMAPVGSWDARGGLAHPPRPPVGFGSPPVSGGWWSCLRRWADAARRPRPRSSRQVEVADDRQVPVAGRQTSASSTTASWALDGRVPAAVALTASPRPVPYRRLRVGCRGTRRALQD